MKKAIFFDIDGTLYQRSTPVMLSTIKAIQALREKGNLVFVCTGRTRVMVLDEPILEIGFDGIIAACGSYGEYNGKEIFSDEIPRDKLVRTIELLEKYQGTYILEGNKSLYYQEDRKIQHALFDIVHKELGENFKSAQEYFEDLKVSKFMYIAKLEQAKEIFKELSKEYRVMSHEPHICECVLPEVSKGKAVEKMCAYLGVDLAQTYAFGDSINDIEMLKTCQVGIVMGNGSKEAKEVADYVTDDISEHGIYNACIHFGLI